jgi:predicted extracellular nuclease
VLSYMPLRILLLCMLPFLLSALKCSDEIRFSEKGEISVAFYNLDNLFDTIDDLSTNDADFTPQGKYRWNAYKYARKLEKLAKVIRQIDGSAGPDVLGVCELENRNALEALANACDPAGRFDAVHKDSEDERGIDVGLIYNRNKMKLLEVCNYPVRLSSDSSDRTRGLLWVKLKSLTSDDTFQFIVCHFPSRREGKNKSMQNRMDAAKACSAIIMERCQTNRQNLVLMGDFNDEPWDQSLTVGLGAQKPGSDSQIGLFNLMYAFNAKTIGTYRYKDQWDILDQLILSAALLDGHLPDYVSASVGIKSDPWLFQKGKYAGYPLRTFGGDSWLNGYSDHLPVFMKIRIRKHA